MFTRVITKELCRAMLTGWGIHEASWDNVKEEYTRSDVDAMTEACGGDAIAGELLVLFSYWSNDIQSIAAVLGVAVIDGKVVDIEPPPSDKHFWHECRWQLYEDDMEKVEVAP